MARRLLRRCLVVSTDEARVNLVVPLCRRPLSVADMPVPRANVGNRGSGVPCHYLPCSSDRAASAAAPWWLCNGCKATGKAPLPNPPFGRSGRAPSSQRG
jgi:hypothetical protein